MIFIILFYLCTQKRQKQLIMNIQQLFDSSGSLTPAEFNRFWAEVYESIDKRTELRGFSAEEVEAFLEMDEDRHKCSCGNLFFNCICYPDAE